MSRSRKVVAPPLPELETEVMGEVWRHDEVTVREVMDRLNQVASSPRAYTTYMTVMSRLVTKGMLARHLVGKTNVFRAVIPKVQYQKVRAPLAVDALLSEYGDVALAHFARRVEDCGAERLEELRRLAADQ